MNNEQKQLISKEIAFLADKISQKGVAVKVGVSAATINHMINNKWDLIKDEIWNKAQSTLKIDLNWNHAETSNYNDLTKLLEATQNRSLSISIAMKEGRSKSHTYRRFDRLNKNVIYVECKNYWTKKQYVKALLTASGLSAEGTVGELIETFISHVGRLSSPIVIIDQADKLKDPQLDLFMDFYNELEGRCAFVVSGVPALKKRIMMGVQRDKIGYREIFSRFGRTFISLEDLKLKDVEAVCVANGIDDADKIVEFYNTCEGDMRRVRRLIEREKLILKKAA